MNRTFLIVAYFLALNTALTAADRKPNILFILADDLGAHDARCFGSKYYETPNIDALAKRGGENDTGLRSQPPVLSHAQ